MCSGDFTVGSKCIPWEIWQLQRRTFLFGLCWQGFNDRVISIGLANFAGTARGTNFNEEFSIDFAKLLPLRRDIIFVVDSFNWANWFASATVNALIRLDIKHTRAFVDAINRAFFDARLIFNIDTRFGNNVRHEESSIWVATAVNCNTYRGLSRLLTTAVPLAPFGEAFFA
jgi:hypothetical protein